MLARGWTFLWVALGMAGFSQAPEFTQQYKQRLGGGIAELKSVVDQFDADADSQGLTRDSALVVLKESSEEFPRKRGQSMQTAIKRYDNLVSQRAALERSDPFFEPVNLLRWPDREMLSGTFTDFKPGLQFTLQAALWALLGGILLGGIGRLPIALGQMVRGRQVSQAGSEAIGPQQHAEHAGSDVLSKSLKSSSGDVQMTGQQYPGGVASGPQAVLRGELPAQTKPDEMANAGQTDSAPRRQPLRDLTPGRRAQVTPRNTEPYDQYSDESTEPVGLAIGDKPLQNLIKAKNRSD